MNAKQIILNEVRKLRSKANNLRYQAKMKNDQAEKIDLEADALEEKAKSI